MLPLITDVIYFWCDINKTSNLLQQNEGGRIIDHARKLFIYNHFITAIALEDNEQGVIQSRWQ